MRFILRFFGFLFSAGAVVFVLLATAGAFFYWKYSQDLPDHAALANYEPPVMTRLHAADGSLLAEYARERRLYLPIQAMPKIVVAAFLSAEDKNFYKHGGIDPEGIVRAVLTNAKSGKKQGASTITQQVAKNFLLSSEQTYDRKIKEALIALRIEATYSKDKILELYLNEIFLGTIVPGRNLHGVAAAALDYFGKSVHELTINEAAYLAALPKGPNNYHPYRKTQAALDRRNEIIGLMAQNGYITREEADAARKMALGVNPRVAFPNAANANYFTEEVRREISERYGEKKLYEGGLSVRATLDPKMQAWARKALVDGLIRYDQQHGWRGPQTRVDLTGRDWGMAVAEVPALGDVAPWRLAVVLSTSGGSVQVGLQPRREASGAVAKERETGTIPPEGMRWIGRGAGSLAPGDVVYVEALEGGRNQFRLRQKPELSGAIVAMDPYTGRVHAMVGGFSFDESEFNRATQAQRQPGSSFKPIVYSAALDNGYTPSSIVQDSPITIEAGPGQEAWTPSNYDGKSGGPHTLRYGIEHSKNLMTVRLAKDVGMPLIAEYARRFGVYDDMLPVLPMSLGAGETTVMRMVTAYSMLANGGRRIRPTLIDRIQDRTGETIYRHDNRKCVGCDAEKWSGQDEPKLVDDSEQVLDPLTAYQMVSIMEGVVQRGTATILKQIGKPLAGKTGTTNDAKDAWFVGFSPDLAVGVYLGFDKPRSLGDRATGGGLAAPIVLEFLKNALKDKPPTPFRVPPGIKLIRVNVASGMRAGSGEGGGTILEAFKPGTAPPDAYVAQPAAPPPGAVPPDADRAAQAGGLY
ncbi:penicillin-binding protein 1A [Methylobacterium oxalidis]|uniref:Penicillin-binding protein 1A n=1 Tax=Methylobacterium oxalidis TaxID=944322 RepID=A0A512J8I3_9HYPH|nr:penicillin-binding protein 1A [Methylobacterium oxalidis]GEP06276.1 penicillin-binding protein [Methylobacterium oxalidis]GJE30936.1 Penicillin-binding protein 1A [Methylobacterium oxalidis]GLS64325.1 penicillin-binding protein [Methylobacterium oxalidis]